MSGSGRNAIVYDAIFYDGAIIYDGIVLVGGSRGRCHVLALPVGPVCRARARNGPKRNPVCSATALSRPAAWRG
ncbi:hypothetical protein GCM10011411_21680 [Aurantiacibacter arachoides]|nr:hypothetical protein GCM10011411_21680 [Aurantiacibacter arachoides]